MNKRSRSVRTALKAGLSDLRARVEWFRLRLEKMPSPVRKVLRRTTFWSANTVLFVALVFSLVLVGAHLWLPTLVDRKPEIESYVGKAIGNPVSFERLTTFWDGINPGVFIEGFQVKSARTDEVAVRLRSVRLTLAWWPLLSGKIEIGSLLITEPNLVVERRPDGQFHVTGFDLDQPESNTPQEVTAWLFRQKELSISNGRMVWNDHRETGKKAPLVIERLNVLLRNNGDRHRIDFHAVFPKDLCADCRFSADIKGKSLTEPDWSGEIRATVRGLQVSQLPAIVRERLPAEIDGVLNIRAQSEWADGRPVRATGSFDIANARIPVPILAAAPPIRRISTSFRWSREGQESSLDLDQLQVGLTRPPVSAGRVRLRLDGRAVKIDADHLDVGDVAAWAMPSLAEGQLAAWLRSAKPEGWIDRLSATLEEKKEAEIDYQVQARLRNWSFAPHANIPGIGNFTGQLTADRSGGELEVDSRDLRLDLPQVFDKAVDVSRLTTRVRWSKEPDDLLVRVSAIDASSPAGHVNGDIELKVPVDSTLSPVIQLKLSGDRGNGKYTANFVPRILPEKLKQYLSQSVRGGTVTRASATLRGPIRNFPFRDGTGIFEVRAHVTNGAFEYLAGWEPITDIEADLFFTGKEMLIAGSRGQVRNIRVDQVVASIADFRAEDGASISVGIRGRGGLDEVLKVLANSGSPKIRSWVSPGLRAEGNGTFYLALHIPTHSPAEFRMDGEYHLTRNVLALPAEPLRFTDLHGIMGFGESGPRQGQVSGRFLSGDVSLESRVDEKGITQLRLEGGFPDSGLGELLGKKIGGYFSGNITWRGDVSLLPNSTEWRAALDLRKLQIALPAPLAKVRDEPLDVELRTLPGGSPVRMPLEIKAGARLNGRVDLERSGYGWEISRGRLGIGERAGPVSSQRGLHIGVRSASLNADEWWPLIRGDEDDRDGGVATAVSRLVAETEALELFGRPFGRIRADVRRYESGWRGDLDGEAAVGQFSVAMDRRVTPPDHAESGAVITLDLERLRIPGPGTSESKASVDPRALPEIHIRSRSFVSGARDFGSLELSGHPQSSGWRVDKLALVRPEANANIEGMWNIDRFGKQSSRFDLSVNSSNFGNTLAALGHGSEAVGGKLTLDAQWSWPDSPTGLDLEELSGEMSFKLSQGRLLRVEPGAGRVLGFFDIMTIPRYLTLDFSSLFGKGLSYNTIQSSLEIENGDAYTRNFEMNAPGANIDLNGKIGLATQTLDLDMGVTPKLMEELAITGGLIGGPAVGAAVAVLHTLVKKPLERNTRIPYKVKGSWQAPSVVRVEVAPEDSQPPP